MHASHKHSSHPDSLLPTSQSIPLPLIDTRSSMHLKALHEVSTSFNPAARDISTRRNAPCCAAPPTRTRATCFMFRFALTNISCMNSHPWPSRGRPDGRAARRSNQQSASGAEDGAVGTRRFRCVPWYFEQLSPLVESLCRLILARAKIIVLVVVKRVSHCEAVCYND